MKENPAPSLSLTDELSELDKKLCRLLAERTRLMAKSAASRRSKGKPAAEPSQERALWAAWEAQVRSSGLDTRLAKHVFVAANSLAYATAERSSRSGERFVLTPRQAPVKVDVTGPTSSVHASLWLTLAAAAGQATIVSPALACDPLVDLVKALNTVGGHLAWEGETFSVRQGSKLAFEEAAVYVGDHAETLWLLVALALAHPGRCRFSGGADLKLADISPVANFLPALGARFASVSHNIPGLPARLEAGGRMGTKLTLPSDCPPAFARALVLAAWTYPEGLELTIHDGASAEAARTAVDVLASTGITASFEDGVARVLPGTPVLPGKPPLPLDPVISATLLALPRVAGGEVRLSGLWPASARGDEAMALLARAGVTVTREPGGLRATAGPWPHPLGFGAVSDELFPLTLALACSHPGGASLVASETQLDHAAPYLDAAGKRSELDGERLTLAAGFDDDRPGDLGAPDAATALALALTSFARPGLGLDNPGIMTAAWPGFWTFLNRLPEIEGTLNPQRRAEPEPAAKKKRRVKAD